MFKCLQIMCAKYYELRCMFKKIHLVNVSACFSVEIGVIFRRPVWKSKSGQKFKSTWELKHANSILQTFEYFCQKSSKSISIILSYTVSKLVHFLRHSVFIYLYISGDCNTYLKISVLHCFHSEVVRVWVQSTQVRIR